MAFPEAYLSAWAGPDPELRGALLDLCATPSEWPSHWGSLVAATSALESGPTTWTLEEPSVEATIQVSVNGLVQPEEAWAHDREGNQLRFIAALGDGDDVLVRYTPVDACP